MNKEQKQMQEKIIQLQILQQTVESLKQRQNLILNQFNEFQITRVAIEELQFTKSDSALIPLGSGNYISGKIENSENILVGIGAGVVLKKSRQHAVEIIDSRTRELQTALEQIQSQIMVIYREAEKLQSELEKNMPKK